MLDVDSVHFSSRYFISQNHSVLNPTFHDGVSGEQNFLSWEIFHATFIHTMLVLFYKTKNTLSLLVKFLLDYNATRPLVQSKLKRFPFTHFLDLFLFILYFLNYAI